VLGQPISYITPFTLLDYPHKSACILWYAGCNMRCDYCYNPEVVLGKGTISFEEVLTFLKKRIGLLDGVVLSGGECLLHKTIVDQIRAIKEMGFYVKIDTNGSKPDCIAQLLEKKLVDYIALDFKALEDQYQRVTHSDLFTSFETTLQLLLQSHVPFEVRTTYHSELVTADDVKSMVFYLEEKGYTGTYYLQAFRNLSETLVELPYSHPISFQNLQGTTSINLVCR
jgi:pyruvate formate lyase activating enzyme